MARVVRARTEVEGFWHDQDVVLEGTDLAPWGAGSPLTVVGRPVSRIDGRERITGRAIYTHDVRLPGLLHARILRSPHAHARVLAIDVSAAEKLPGVHAVLHRGNAPAVTFYATGSPLFDDHVRYAGDEVAAVAAVDPETARDALEAIRVDYEVLAPVLDPEAALAPGAPLLFPDGNRAGREERTLRGDPEAGFREADEVVSLEVRTPGALHNALETHGAVAWLRDGTLTLWDSTQFVHGIRKSLAAKLGLPLGRVRVIKDYMGGGFGAKNGLRKYHVIAAHLTRVTGRPVRAVLDRHEENVAAGNRAPAVVRVRLGARRDGTLTAIHVTSWSAIGAYGGGSMPVTGPAKTLYACPNVLTVEHAARTSTGPHAAFRAPGYVEGTTALESAMDELSRKLGMDPQALRARNHAATDPASGLPYTGKALDLCLKKAVELLGTRRMPAEGAIRRGVGLACGVWGAGGGPPAYALVKIAHDGSAVVVTGTQDIGTGTRTVLAQIAAEELGFPLERVSVLLGDTEVGLHAPLSAGSMTLASVGPAVRMAAADARTKLVAVAAAVLGTAPEALAVRAGAIVRPGSGAAPTPVEALAEKVDDFTLVGYGERHPNPADRVVKSFGAHAAEVEVDTGTGEVRVLRYAAAHDIGRVVNPKLATSQVMGGILMGLGLALFEERVLDPVTARPLNPGLEGYRVATSADVPRVAIAFVGGADAEANNVGARGLGEPPIIPVAAAIGNAVRDAIDRRPTVFPLTPARVLALLGKAPPLPAETELHPRPPSSRSRARRGGREKR